MKISEALLVILVKLVCYVHKPLKNGQLCTFDSDPIDTDEA